MVQIDAVRACNSSLVKAQPLVAVFVGGTGGIGENTIRALAATHSDQGKGLRLYIVGRNANAAKKISSDCAQICPGGQFRFVQAQDLALLTDVDRVCAEIIQSEENEGADGGKARVDLLVMSQAFTLFQPRKETKEGLEQTMSLRYYSRMRFIVQLLPLLLASPLPAHVVSVYAAGMEGKLFPEDLSLRGRKHYDFANSRSHAVYMTTLFMETLAERHRGQLSLVHVYPGLVITGGFQDVGLPLWFKVTWWLAAPIARRFALSPSDNGQRILFLATPRFPARQRKETAKGGEVTGVEGDAGIAIGSDGTRGSGTYAVNWDGETISTEQAYKNVRDTDLAQQVWDHTFGAFGEVEAGRVFTG